MPFEPTPTPSGEIFGSQVCNRETRTLSPGPRVSEGLRDHHDACTQARNSGNQHRAAGVQQQQQRTQPRTGDLGALLTLGAMRMGECEGDDALACEGTQQGLEGGVLIPAKDAEDAHAFESQ